MAMSIFLRLSACCCSFEVKERAAREGKNPRTGEAIQIEASKTAAFSASKNLKDRLNG